jgi:hypothetical protein
MNRDDWVVVGMRLYGLYLVVNAILGVMDLAQGLSLGPTNMGWQVVKVGLRGLIGLILFLGAPGVMNWLKRKDDVVAQADKLKQPDRPQAGR